MKRTIKYLCLVLASLAVCLTFSSCGGIDVKMENLLSIDKSFKGSRTVTLNFGKNFDSVGQLDTIVENNCPSAFSYESKNTDDGYIYVFTLSFENKKDYLAKLAAVLNRQPAVAFGTPESRLASGWRITEDFDSTELVSWLQKSIDEQTEGNKFTVNLKADSNLVNMGGDIRSSSGSTLDVNAVEGLPVNSVSVETTNNKNDKYDRQITISVPQSTYDSLGDEAESVFADRCDEKAKYKGFTQSGNNQEYRVVYQGITAAELQTFTANLLDCSEELIVYGDETNSSTPLAEQLLFEEDINVLSFVPKDGQKVDLYYKYSLPIRTTHGEGVVFTNGVWQAKGEWTDGKYALKDNSLAYKIRVPDGIQYTIEGINVNLESKGGDNFVRTFDFVYNGQTGAEGAQYAVSFFNNHGTKATLEKPENQLACRISFEGSAKDISESLGNLFGGGNYLSFAQNTSAMAVVTDVTVNDSINLSYMLTGSNAAVPFTYTAQSTGSENISSLYATANVSKSKPKTTVNKDNIKTLAMTGGENLITYTATIPYTSGIVVYLIISIVMLVLAMIIIYMLMRKNRRLNAADKLINTDAPKSGKEDDTAEIKLIEPSDRDV